VVDKLLKGRTYMARLHLGINTCFAVKRWPEPQQWLSMVKEELGLDCCQFSLNLADPMLDENAVGAYADAVKKCAAANNIVVHSTFTGLAAYSWSMLLHPDEAMRAAAMHWYERAIDFSARLGALGTGGHLGALSVRDAQDMARKDVLIQEMMQRLQSLSRYAAQKGLQFLLFENMAVTREWGHSIEEAQTLTNLVVQAGVPLILCIDVGHPCALHTGTPSDDYSPGSLSPGRIHLWYTCSRLMLLVIITGPSPLSTMTGAKFRLRAC
jgi:sugar phosphate isomerase/epimerase